MGAVIAKVYPDSIAERLGLLPGQRVAAVNGLVPEDLIQFQWEWAGEEVRLSLETEAGVKEHLIRKGYDEGLGVQFEEAVFDGVRPCANRCVFCFVDQMAPGCRASLYIKDDDYRLSFLQGSYVTLTNLSAGDIARIEALRLSPLYVSVHATDPAARSRLLGRRGPDRLLDILGRLGKAGIEFHCQIVLCPGYNDGGTLERTVRELGRLAGVLSLAIVPVGLTRYRQGLPGLRPVSEAEAAALIQWLKPFQDAYLRERGSRFLWLADEFYILANQEPPPAAVYEDYPQWENGVGLIRGLLEEAAGYPWPSALLKSKNLILAGGTAAMQALAPLWARLRQIQGLSLELIPLVNRFFGSQVNVSGLLTGKCLVEGLGARALPAGAEVFLPGVMVRDGEGRFLDGLTVAEVEKTLKLRLVFLPAAGDKLIEKLLNP